MLKQRAIFNLRSGERKTIKTNESFNCLRLSYYIDLATTPNTDCFEAANFDLKSKSFTGDLFQLLLLNCCEANHYNQNETNYMRFDRAIYQAKHTLAGYNDPYRHYICEFEVYFTAQNEIDLGLKLSSIARYNNVTIECLYTDKNFNLCHTWQLVKNIGLDANFEVVFDEEKCFCLCAGDPVRYESKLNEKSILQTENGSFDFPFLVDTDVQYSTVFGSYALELPAIWFDVHKNVSIVHCSMGNNQKSANLYCY